MADCVEARKAHQVSLTSIHDFEKMLKTERYANRTAADKEILKRHLAELKAASEDKSSKVTEALKHLKDTNWWPIGPNQDESAAEKYNELIQYAVQLNSTATEMYQEYIKNIHNTVASGSAPETAVDIPPSHDPNARPLKRRRLSNAADSTPAVDPTDAADYETLCDRLGVLEGRLADIHSDVLALDSEKDEELMAHIDTKLESISLNPHDLDISSSNFAELDQVKQSVKHTNVQLADLANAVTLLMSESERISAQSDALHQEEQKYPDELAAVSLSGCKFQRSIDGAPFVAAATIPSIRERQRGGSKEHGSSHHSDGCFEEPTSITCILTS